MTQETPITDDVRDQRGDYLAAVEDLELSHAALLAACEGFLKSLALAKHSGLTPAKDYSDWATVEYVIRSAIAAAKGVGGVRQEQVYQPRYLAYCKAHGKAPEDMLAFDNLRGGTLAWFSPWIQAKWAQFDQSNGRRYRCGSGWTEEGHRLFDEWLRSDLAAAKGGAA